MRKYSLSTILLTTLLSNPFPVQSQIYQWGQTGGGGYRNALWPSLLYDPPIPPPEEDPNFLHSIRNDVDSTTNLRQTDDISPHKINFSNGNTPLQARRKVPNLIYEITSSYMLQKSPSITVTTSGQVILLTDECNLVALPTPDIPGTVWRYGQEIWVSTIAYNKSAHSRCFDAVLDENDNIYHAVRLDNTNQALFYGYATNSFQNPPTLLWPPSNLQGDLRLIEFYAISLLYTKHKVWVPMDGSDNFNGLAIVDTLSGNVTKVSVGGAFGEEGVTGSAKIPLFGGDDLAVFPIAHELDAKGSFLYAFDDKGNKKWSTSTQVYTDVDQPHPLYDPFSRRIFAVAFEGEANDYRIAIYCYFTTGSSCSYPWSDTGVQINDNFNSFQTIFVYAGAVVVNADETGIDRLLYSFPLMIASNEPVGCIIAISPANGAVIDSYCIPRDPASSIAAYNYVATGPLVAMNARGQGMHNVYVGLFDSTIVALDPYNLAGGILFQAVPNTILNEATIAADFLSMTAGGTLVYPVWNDDDNGRYSVIAIPGINNFIPDPPIPSNNAPTTTGLSSGGAAGVSITVLILVGAFIAFPVYKAGGINNALERYGGVKGGLSGVSFSVPSSISSFFSGIGGGQSYSSISSSSSSSRSMPATSSSLSGYGAATSGSYQSSSSSYQSIGSKDVHSSGSMFQSATDL